jgi:hypothetical protein
MLDNILECKNKCKYHNVVFATDTIGFDSTMYNIHTLYNKIRSKSCASADKAKHHFIGTPANHINAMHKRVDT